MLTRLSILPPVALAGTIALVLFVTGATAAHAHPYPQWCEYPEDVRHESTPEKCLPPTGHAAVCHELEHELSELSDERSRGHQYLHKLRYNRPITVRDKWAVGIRGGNHATQMAAHAERQYPGVLDRIVAADCPRETFPVGTIDGSYTNGVLLDMVDKGTMTWERWQSWVTP